eukprot:s6370_g3.t2
MLGDTITLPSQACGRGQLSDDAWGHEYVTIASLWPWATWRRCLGTRLRYHRKLVAVSNLATMLGDTITLPSQACGRGHLSDDAWGHDYVTITSLWPWATFVFYIQRADGDGFLAHQALQLQPLRRLRLRSFAPPLRSAGGCQGGILRRIPPGGEARQARTLHVQRSAWRRSRQRRRGLKDAEGGGTWAGAEWRSGSLSSR